MPPGPPPRTPPAPITFTPPLSPHKHSPPFLSSPSLSPHPIPTHPTTYPFPRPVCVSPLHLIACMDASGPAGPSSTSAAGSSGSGDAPPPPQAPPPPPQLSRYESQKRRDWNTFLQYLRNHRPPLTLARCSGAHVIEFLKYLDQFGKTKVHVAGCAYYGQPSPPAPCPCPLRQAWGSLDALIGRLRAAYEENGGAPESNPFAARAVRIYLREVRDAQAKARGIPYEKKKRKRSQQAPATTSGAGEPSGSSSAAVTAAASASEGGGGGEGSSGSTAAASTAQAGGGSTTAPSASRV